MLDWESSIETEEDGKDTPNGATSQQNWLGAFLKTIADLGF